MFKRKISLFASISASFAFIIIISFFLGLAIEHLNTTRHLPVLLTEVESAYMARSLSLLYSRQGNWDNLASTVRDLTTAMPDHGGENVFRVIVEDNSGKVLYNSFSELMDSSSSGLIEGKSENLIDYINGMTIGRITLFVGKGYLAEKTTEYLISAFREQYRFTIGAVLIALIPAALLSGRLTKPLSRLSKVSREIRSGNIIQIPETSRTREMAELTRSFNQMSDTLKKQRELRQRLIGDLSHEINTPLNIIDLEARGIQEGLIEETEGLKSIRSEIDKLSGLIKDLEWLAETDAGEISLEKHREDLVPVVEEEMERWHYKGEKLGIKLIFLKEDNVPLVDIDPFRICQVLSNLLENSLKYAPESEEIAVRLFREKNQVFISVTDQGPGIPPGETDEIFERLYRLENSRNSKTGGRGLGLSIVKSIMEMHGGTVSVKNGPEKGSIFTLSFPVPASGRKK